MSAETRESPDASNAHSPELMHILNLVRASVKHAPAMSAHSLIGGVMMAAAELAVEKEIGHTDFVVASIQAWDLADLKASGASDEEPEECG